MSEMQLLEAETTTTTTTTKKHNDHLQYIPFDGVSRLQ
jgi:hypothetical protein